VFNPVQTFTPYFSTHLVFQIIYSLDCLPTVFLHTFVTSPVRITHPIIFISFHLITVLMLGETGQIGQYTDEATGWMNEVQFPAGEVTGFHHRFKIGSGDHPASYQMGVGALTLRIKLPGSEADNSPQSSAQIKNVWSYTSTPPVCLHGVMLS
jgi:hypothetical protein